jgi:outer membrane receptor for ferrienterochelin and colicins
MLRANNITKKLGVSLIGLLLCFVCSAQDVQLKILDAVSLSPIEGVNIYVKDKSGKNGGVRSAKSGKAIISDFKFPIMLSMSRIGYKKDTSILTEENLQWKNYGYYLTVMMKPRSTHLKPTVITGRLRPVLGNNSIYKVNSITESDIAKLAAVNLTDVLQFEMNQFVSNDNILGASSNVGGIGAQNIKILLNGVPLNGSEAGFIDLNQINLSNVKRIETVPGPMSVMYGSNALGGVINIITKEASKKSEFGLRSYMDNLMHFNATMDAGWKNKKQNLKLSLGRNFFQGWSPNDSLSRWLLWKPKVQYNADLAYRYRLKKGKISLYSFFLDEKIENRGVPSVSPIQAFALDEYYLTKRFRNTVNFDYQLSPKEYFKSQNTFSVYNRRKNRYRKDMVSLESKLTDDINDHDTSVFNQYHFRGAVNSSRIKKTDLIVGYELNHETSRSSKISDRRQNMTEIGLFTSANYELGKLSIMPSFRMNMHSVFKRNYSYGLHLKYSPNNKLHYRASIAQGYRTPNIKELYLEFIDNNHRILGNEDLKQEEGLHAQLSAEKQWSIKKKNTIVLEGSLMYNLLQDKISLQTISIAQNELQYFNIDNFENLVSSIRLKYTANDLQGSLGYSRTEVLQSTGLPANSFSEILASTSYLIPKIDTRLNLFYRYTANQPIYFVDGSFAMSNPMHVSNASLTKTFAKKIRLQVGVKNVFNIRSNQFDINSSQSPHGSESSTTLLLPRSVFTEILIKL